MHALIGIAAWWKNICPISKVPSLISPRQSSWIQKMRRFTANEANSGVSPAITTALRLISTKPWVLKKINLVFFKKRRGFRSAFVKFCARNYLAGAAAAFSYFSFTASRLCRDVCVDKTTDGNCLIQRPCLDRVIKLDVGRQWLANPTEKVCPAQKRGAWFYAYCYPKYKRAGSTELLEDAFLQLNPESEKMIIKPNFLHIFHGFTETFYATCPQTILG